MNQIVSSIVCPDCEECSDKCFCDNGVKLNIKVNIPKVELKDKPDNSSVVESVQQTFPFMHVH